MIHLRCSKVIKQIRIYNLQGALVLTANGRDLQQLQIAGLNTGVYIIKAETEFGSVHQKFIKD
jgi:hypothetical protein